MFIHGSPSVTLLDLWWLQHSPPDLPEQLSAPLCGYGGEGPWLHHFTFFLLPPTCDSEGSRSSVQLHPLASNAVNRLVPSPYSCFTVCWATVWLLNYCIWNQLPNRAAKNTPSNQIMVMWVDELFLYTVLVPNKSLNPFRTWKRKVKQEYHQQYLVLC